ncbi:DUF1015 family protein [Pseudoalteromonas piscicida]|uniref:DUF1015 family protein n=1 Tax=Pseudoalteromonas piscicida TaxID=43662 RepID=UPI003981C045
MLLKFWYVILYLKWCEVYFMIITTNEPLHLYQVEQGGILVTGLLTEFDVSALPEQAILPHESVSVSHAMALKKRVQLEKLLLPPCLLIGRLNLDEVRWQAECVETAQWYSDCDECTHRLYAVENPRVLQEFRQQISMHQQWLIADGHHRMFAASQRHAPQSRMMAWLVPQQEAVVTSFAVQASYTQAVDVTKFKQHLSDFDICECSETEADYTIWVAEVALCFALQHVKSDSYLIQTQLRRALQALPAFEELWSNNKVELSDDPHVVTAICRDPHIEDIFTAAKAGKYFPEKSTLFTHKADSQVLYHLNQQAICA